MGLNFNFRVCSLSPFLILLCLLLFDQFDVSKSATLNSEVLNNTTKTNATTRPSITPVTRKFPKFLEDKVISTYKPSVVHGLLFYNFYREYQFIVRARSGDGIIMVVQDLFMGNGNESVSNGTCPNFIQVTQVNGTFPKICGEVKVGDNSSTPSGLIGPRTLIFSGRQIIVNIKQHHFNHDRQNIRGKLVFTGFTREWGCGMSSYFVTTKSCSIGSGNRFGAQTYERQICIPKSLFCDQYYNCGNTSGNANGSFSYDESSCDSLIQNAGTGSRPGSGRFPILFPIVHQSPTYNNPSNSFKPFSSYNSPSNTLYKPSNTFSNYNNVPKYSSGYSGGSTKTVTKASGKGFKWLIGGALAILGGIGSLFGCKKKSEQPGSNSTPTEQFGRPEIAENDEDLRTSFLQRPEDIAPPKYEPDNNLPVDEAPPTYQDSTRTEAGFRVPPPYKNC